MARKWDNGISEDKTTLFIALTFYFGIVKKDLLSHYWSVDSVMSTPFPRSVMSRQELFNIMSFLHCCDSSDYPGRGQPRYNPRKKLRKCSQYCKRGFRQSGHHNAIFRLMKGPYHSKVTYTSKFLIP